VHQIINHFSVAFDDACYNEKPNSGISLLSADNEFHDADSIWKNSKKRKTIREIFLKMSWFASVVTLDSPAAIQRYSVPRDIFNEETIRRIMIHRAEFSREAIQRAKISIV